MALKGTLKEFNAADIFQLIAQQNKTGILQVNHKKQKAMVEFRVGSVMRAEYTTRDVRSVLGAMLVRAEVITEKQLADVMRIHERTYRKVEDILVEKDLVTPDVLKHFVYLKTTETIYRIFLWKEGAYEFLPSDVPERAPYEQPINTENLLMEGVRRVDEWPMIQQSLGGFETTFVLQRDLDGKPLPDAQPDLPQVVPLSANDRFIYALIVPKRSMQKIIDLSRMGEFEACKSLYNLIKGGYIIEERAGELIKEESGGLLSGTSRASQRPRQVLNASIYTLIFFLVFFLVRITDLKENQVRVEEQKIQAASQPARYRYALADAQMQRIRLALETWRLERSDYPDSLDDLIREGYLEIRDKTWPWNNPYRYRKKDNGYQLTPPLQ